MMELASSGEVMHSSSITKYSEQHGTKFWSYLGHLLIVPKIIFTATLRTDYAAQTYGRGKTESTGTAASNRPIVSAPDNDHGALAEW
jgi:hypothetical protein